MSSKTYNGFEQVYTFEQLHNILTYTPYSKLKLPTIIPFVENPDFLCPQLRG